MGNRETVTIYGQEYTIAGSSSEEQIREVARYVDDMMSEIAAAAPQMSVSSLAVLTAVNVTNDYFDVRDKSEEQAGEIADLQKDVAHFETMWEEAKSGLKQYREDAQNSIDRLQEMQRIFNTKNVESNRVTEELEISKKRIEELENQLAASSAQIEEAQARNAATVRKDSEDAADAKRKYKELESSFFDIQMENIQLKNELDSLKKAKPQA